MCSEVKSPIRPSTLGGLVVLQILLGMAYCRLASANTITVNIATENDHLLLEGGCSLRKAIKNHNSPGSPLTIACAPGDGDDIIVFNIKQLAVPPNTVIPDAPLPPISGTLTIGSQSGSQGNNCINVIESAYLAINSGAKVTLKGVGFDANGSSERSVIENNGGTLTIEAASNGSCKYSNEKKGPPVISGGILANRSNGTTTISGANFVDSSASPANGQSSKGGGINVDSGVVTITDSITSKATNFINDTADQGGAIYVNRGATLNIASNNFAFTNNKSASGGAGIYSLGGNVNVRRGTSTLTNVSFANNAAGTGGAVYGEGGNLSVDGVEFGNNSTSGSGGAVVVSNIKPPNTASLTRNYFHGNTAGVFGGAIYVVSGSTLNVSGDTFTGDFATGNSVTRPGAGIYVDSLGNLKVANSTFQGASSFPGGLIRDERITSVSSGLGEVTFSTLLATDLAGISPGILRVSNSILRDANCLGGISNDQSNLEFASIGCPGSNTILDLDPRGLFNNGGPTLTVGVLDDSPAIGAIKNGECTDQEGNPVTTDQRVFTRPATPGGPCTIGAFEFGATSAPGGIGGIPPDSLP